VCTALFLFRRTAHLTKEAIMNCPTRQVSVAGALTALTLAAICCAAPALAADRVVIGELFGRSG
jgi:hypothetical protein